MLWQWQDLGSINTKMQRAAALTGSGNLTKNSFNVQNSRRILNFIYITNAPNYLLVLELLA